MSRLRLHALALGTLIILLSGMVLGQVAQATPARQDVFAEVHGNLSDAADRVLAASLADKAWMKASQGTARGESGASGVNPIPRLRDAVERVDRLRPTIEPLLRSEGIPAELSAVVLVESGGLPQGCTRCLAVYARHRAPLWLGRKRIP